MQSTQPIGHSEASAFSLKLIGRTDTQWISLNSDRQAARRLAQEIGKAAGLRLDGLAALELEAFTLNADLSLAEALQLLAESSGRAMQQLSSGHFRFEWFVGDRSRARQRSFANPAACYRGVARRCAR